MHSAVCLGNAEAAVCGCFTMGVYQRTVGVDTIHDATP